MRFIGACLFGVGLFALVPSCTAPAETTPVAPAESDQEAQTQVVLLGTGTPDAEPERSGPAVAIVVNESPYLVDFGPGVVRRAAAAARAGISALDVRNLTRAFVTHLHSDHTAGYPDLILTPWALGRHQPLEVYGPEGIGAMTDHLLEAYRRDIEMRLSGDEEADPQGHKVIVREIDPGIVYQDENVTVEAFLVNHGSWPEAFGYKFVTPDKTIVISGDTAPSEKVVEQCSGCDILIHEVYSLAGFLGRPLDWQGYHTSFHTSSRELAELASRARPGLLILYHQLFWGVSDEELVSELKAGYDGHVVSGKDLEVY